MRSKSFFILVTALLLSSSARAADAQLEQWANLMQRELPAGMCSQNKAMRACIRTSDQACQVGLERTTRICLSRVLQTQGAQRINTDGYKQLGSEVGDCAEDLFAIEHRATLIDTPSCSEYKQVVEHSKWK
jgi:hypothetical protein